MLINLNFIYQLVNFFISSKILQIIFARIVFIFHALMWDFTRRKKKDYQVNIEIQTHEASIPSLKQAKILQKSAILLKAINQVCKILIQRHKQAIQLIVSEEEILKEDQKKRKIFLQTWKRLRQSTHIKPIEHQKISQIVTDIVKRKIKDICLKMTENQYTNYGLIVDQNYKILIKNAKKQGKLQLTKDNMIKIDILSTFFLKNSQIKSKYGKYFVTPLITFDFLTNIFDFKDNSLLQILQGFEDFKQYLTLNYRDRFENILNFTCLVELKKRYMSIIKRSGCIAQKMALNLQIVFNQPQSKSKNKSDEKFKYQLSEVIFLLKGSEIQSKKLQDFSICEIFDKLKTIQHINDHSQQKRQLLRIKHEYSVGFKSLFHVFHGLVDNYQIKESYSKQLKWKQQLIKCQWAFISGENFATVMRQITGLSFNPNVACKSNKQMCNILLQLSLKRFNLFALVGKLQIDNLYNSNQKQVLYICRFQYSYENLKKNMPIKRRNTDDQKCTLILVTNESNILFYVVQGGVLSYNRYSKFLKRFFTNQRKSKNFTLFLYQFKLKRIFYWPTYIELLKYFKQKFNSFVYITNYIEKFKLHFILDAAVSTYLQYLSQTITRDNFISVISDVIIMLATRMRNNLSKQQIQGENSIKEL